MYIIWSARRHSHWLSCGDWRTALQYAPLRRRCILLWPYRRI